MEDRFQLYVVCSSHFSQELLISLDQLRELLPLLYKHLTRDKINIDLVSFILLWETMPQPFTDPQMQPMSDAFIHQTIVKNNKVSRKTS